MSAETKPEAIRDQDEAISLSYWLAEQMGEHVDDQGDETLTETVQRYVSREWMPKTGVNPTPAPLDPKSVHVGDTVTIRFIETGDVLTTKAYQPDDITATGEYVYILGWPLHRANGTFGLAVSHFEILAIEPAAMPEPEWKPGMTGTATVAHLAGGTAVLDMRVMRVEWDGLLGFATQTGRIVEDGSTEWRVYDLMPDEPRPLPTRGELYAALTHSDVLKTDPRSGLTYIDPNLATERLAVFLRGESR